MTTATNADRIEHVPELRDQTVVGIRGSSGIGLATARRARGEGADVVLTARDVTRLDLAGRELGAQSMATFDATDPQQLERFFAELPTPSVQAADVAALAVHHLMTNTALTGATYDVDGGQQIATEAWA